MLPASAFPAVARTEESVNLRKGSKTTKLFSKIKIPIYLIHIHRQAAPFAARNRDYPVVYAHSIHAYEVYACEVHACEMHIYGVYTHEVHACEVHAYKV